MKKNIKLPNRYNRKYELAEIEPYKYKIVNKNKEEFPFYVTYRAEDPTEIKFIDWDGATPICIGDTIEGATVIKITYENGNGFVVLLKEKDSLD